MGPGLRVSVVEELTDEQRGERFTIWVCPDRKCPGAEEFDVERATCQWHRHPDATHTEPIPYVPLEVVALQDESSSRAVWPPTGGSMPQREIDAIRRAMVNREIAP